MLVDRIGYKFMDDLEQWDSCRSSQPIRPPEWMNAINTPLDWREWDRCLADHPDERFRRYIVNGIREGFRVGYDYRRAGQIRSAQGNMSSTQEHPEIIRDYLAKECSEGRVLGPFDPARFPQVHTSKFGVIPKSTPGKWRLIVDMSHPEGNDGIEPLGPLEYVSVEDAARAVEILGRGALMAKVDVQPAYRNVPVHPEDRWLLGMMWEGALFIDTTLPFGLRSAPKIFTAIADAVEWIAKRYGVRFVIHYLDDFLIIAAPNSPE